MKYVDEFIKYLRVIKKHSEYTINNYCKDLVELYDFKNDILSFSESDRDAYLECLYARGLSRNSISRKLSSIRTFFEYLKEEEYININYFREVHNPKKVLALPKYAKYQDLEKLFSCFDRSDVFGQRNALILEMLYATGVRVSELVNIKVSDINFYDHTIMIMGKGRKMRMVFYGSYCEDILNIYLHDGYKKLNKKGIEYLFLNKNGNKLSSRYVAKVIDDAVRKCQVDYHISPHTLRHTFATDLLNSGADLMSVKELLGHSSINTTSIYTHVSSDQLRRVYDFSHPRAKE